MDYKARQDEELNALQAIFDADFQIVESKGPWKVSS